MSPAAALRRRLWAWRGLSGRAVLAASALLTAGALCLAEDRADGDLVFEAELCREMTAPWRPVQIQGASGGLALTIPEGAGSSEAFERGREGRARFDVPGWTGGERELWLRVYWNGNCSNSLFVVCQPDRGLVTVDSYTMRTWHWVKVPGLRLPPGGAALDLVNREDGVWVDQLCIRPVGPAAPVGMLRALADWPPPGPAAPAVSVVPAPGGPGIEALPPRSTCCTIRGCRGSICAASRCWLSSRARRRPSMSGCGATVPAACLRRSGWMARKTSSSNPLPPWLCLPRVPPSNAGLSPCGHIPVCPAA